MFHIFCNFVLSLNTSGFSQKENNVAQGYSFFKKQTFCDFFHEGNVVSLQSSIILVFRPNPWFMPLMYLSRTVITFFYFSFFN